MIWHEIPESKYIAALESMPPATQTAHGFLFGEASSHFAGMPTFTAYLNVSGKFYQGSEPMTVREFRAFHVFEIDQKGRARS
jgi:hypothetical protein